jgi:NAD(P)-dependent dehydrogenase (short-subunit alcohol dehydrogenase family)
MASYDVSTCGSELVRDYRPHIQGKTILITGASPGGLGGFCAETLAAAGPALLILAGRNSGKLQKTADAIAQTSAVVETRLLIVDFESFRSVREAADVVNNAWTDVPAIDVLVNNAGIMACDYAACPEGGGNERQLTANHLGPFLFTNIIMGKILAAKAPRIVNVSSDGHRLSPFRFADYNFDVRRSNVPFFLVGGKQGTDSFCRTVKRTISGTHTGSRRRRIC